MPATAASRISLWSARRSDAVSEGEPDREQGEPALEAEHAADLEAGVIAAEVGDGEDEQGQAGAAEQQGEPLARLDRVAEDALRHHREGDGATGEHGLDDRDRRHREGRDVDEPGHRGESPAGGEPGGGGEAAGAAQRFLQADRRGAMAAPVLEQRGEVGQQRRGNGEADPYLHANAATSCPIGCGRPDA